MGESMKNALKSIVSAARATQVELKGRYSVERLHELKQYCAEVNYWNVAAIIAATPLPCLIFCLLVDAVPLPDPNGGMKTSTIVWVRSFIVLGVMTWTQMDQCRRFVDKIPQTMGFTIFATLFITSGCVLTQIVVGFTVGYPVPFAMVLAAPAWISSYLILFGVKFGRLIMHNKDARYDLICFTAMMATEVTMGIGYPMYNVAFYALHSYSRMAFTVVLPMMKLALKVVFHRLSSKHEDLLPEVVIFNIEVYHSLFVACYMQSPTSMSTTSILMAINASRSVLAIYDVNCILQRIKRRCKGMPSLTSSSTPSTYFDIAGYILRQTEKAKRHNSIRVRSEHRTSSAANSLARTSTTSMAPLTTVATLAKNAAPKILPQRRAQSAVAPKAATFDVHNLTWTINEDDKKFLDSLSDNCRVMVAIDILQLLHVTEFLILIQFAEVMIPALYSKAGKNVGSCVLLHTHFSLLCRHLLVHGVPFPNRKYYSQIRDLDAHQLSLTIEHVLIYALLELAALLVVAWILQRNLRISVVKQLAFVLRAEWIDVQSRLLFWVSYIFQNFLTQYGTLR